MFDSCSRNDYVCSKKDMEKVKNEIPITFVGETDVLLELMCVSLSYSSLESRLQMCNENSIATDLAVQEGANYNWTFGKSFFGIIKEIGYDVHNIREGDIVGGIGDNKARFVEPYYLIIDSFNLVKVLSCGQEVSEVINRMVSILKSHVISIRCAADYLQLKKEDSLAIFATKLDDTISILDLVLSLDILVFIFLPENEVERYRKLRNSNFSSFFSYCTFTSHISNVEVYSINKWMDDNENEKPSFFTVNAVAVLSQFLSTLQINESKFVRFLLKICAPEGHIVFIDKLSQVDPIECDILHIKSISLCFFNFNSLMISQACHGVHMHALLEVLNKFAKKEYWLPPNESIRKYSFNEVDKAIKFAESNADAYTICTNT